MSLLERLFSIPTVRKAIWRLWYPFLTRRLRGEEVLFLNYAFETDPPVGLKLDPADEPNRACIQLYHHVATQVDLQGTNVLEVSCGHGGGALALAIDHAARDMPLADVGQLMGHDRRQLVARGGRRRRRGG